MNVSIAQFFLFAPLLHALTFGAPSPTVSHENAERDFTPAYASLATGELGSKRNGARHPWPVSVISIGHTIGSYQRYELGEPYFHHGLDIRAEAGSDVRAASGGKVINIENYVPGYPAYWEIAILDDDGFIWQYHHVDRTSIPDSLFDALKSGARVEQGTKIGEVFYWEVVTFGERFNHIHLNVLGKDKKYLSAFNFLVALPDRSAPEVNEIGILQDGKKVDGNHVSGDYSLYAHVSDLVLSDVFTVPPHEIGYQIDNRDPVEMWRFDRLPGETKTDFVDDFYVPDLVCGDYKCRKPVVNLGFKTKPRQIFPKTPGHHWIKVIVKDFENNRGEKEFSWIVD